MHIGSRIKEVCEQKNVTAQELSKLIHCDRSNVYYIFKRDNIDIKLLQEIGKALNHDFFQDLSNENKTQSSFWTTNYTFE
ncbi:MAG: helix-turn-helix transcriptional regulator [Bacteroidales bacterium]|nr:helix-turn-helix transcriptional regulator [Candidatus Scybalousia scybalohippi]